ncbi:hypothetical protein CcI49_28460 [Frankia sp. CcI49]|nr:hypothetical protein CcI49_28460 [Frankia sp. CcI49]
MGPLSGSEIARSELAKATMDKLAALRRSTGNERHATAAMVWEYPEDRRLGDDVFANTARLDEHLSEVAILASVEEQGGLQAIVAAGGICGPTAADWQVDVLGSQARPLRDSLPSYQAVRGGVRFTPPPTLAGVGGSATAVWTAANDANPTSPATKPVQTFACPNPVEEFVDALPTRLQFSNFQGRFSPEIVEANTELALANAARVAEVNLLVKMASGSTRTGAGSLVSFSRDLFPVLDVLATGMRYRHRLPNGEAGAPVFPLRAVFPSWVRGALRTDLTRELAHDRAVASSDVLALTDAYITTMFAARGIIPTWVMDGLPRSTGGSTLGTNAYDYPDQFFAAPGANSSLSAPPADASAGSAAAGTYWPSRLTFFLFPEGTWLFLDGGRIDLGVITDSTLNATNQYQTFVEPFEGLAKRGAESLQVVVPVKPSGASVAGITPPSTFAY